MHYTMRSYENIHPDVAMNSYIERGYERMQQSLAMNALYQMWLRMHTSGRAMKAQTPGRV